MNWLKKFFKNSPAPEPASKPAGTPPEKTVDAAVFPHVKSMIEISFEYVGWNAEEVDALHVFCSLEGCLLFTFFYMISGQAVKRHNINEHLKAQYDVSEAQQSGADQIGLEDLEAIRQIFRDFEKPVPTRIYISYLPATQKMTTEFSYENRLIGTDLMEEDLMQEWMAALEKGGKS